MAGVRLAVGLHDKYDLEASFVVFTNLFIIPAVAMMYLAIRERKMSLGGNTPRLRAAALLCGVGVSVDRWDSVARNLWYLSINTLIRSF
ncbi:MAG: hypothetical protein IPG76_23920 [Acidobacteria bacterium]|nr:hypothetical protein [Acidobacteriota bacterium]